MYYAVTFVVGERAINSWTDWHLVPSSRPVIQPPKPKKTMIDIPGSSNRIDLTETLAGDVTYSNRTGSIEFIVNPLREEYTWYDIYNMVMNDVHGRRVKLSLEEEPDWYYEGRVEVNNWASNEDYSRITLDYDLDPFKYQATATEQTITLTNNYVMKTFTSNRMPIVPKFTLSGNNASCTVKYKRSEYALATGESAVAAIRFEEGDNYIEVKGSGTLKITYRGGKL